MVNSPFSMTLFGSATGKIHLFTAICRGHITPFITSLVGGFFQQHHDVNS